MGLRNPSLLGCACCVRSTVVRQSAPVLRGWRRIAPVFWRQPRRHSHLGNLVNNGREEKSQPGVRNAPRLCMMAARTTPCRQARGTSALSMEILYWLIQVLKKRCLASSSALTSQSSSGLSHLQAPSTAGSPELVSAAAVSTCQSLID